ncbi:MAG TPA: DUF1648 domain-containing protein [Verrucomicrobiae bacterium]|nr:DUF1648 domain-containing protein [Verrucomicrobiae bacterium]
MKKNVVVPLVALLVLSGGYLLLVTALASQLPERVAIHFGAGGNADGWMPREQGIAFFRMLTFVPAIFVILAMLMKWMPAWTFNLPNRDYWLAPERRDETIEAIAGQLIWIGCLMTLFMAGIFGLTIVANRLTPPHLPMDLFAALLTCFIGGTIVWTILFMRRFRKPSA